MLFYLKKKLMNGKFIDNNLENLPLLVDDPKPIVIAFNNNEIHPIWPTPPQ